MGSNRCPTDGGTSTLRLQIIFEIIKGFWVLQNIYRLHAMVTYTNRFIVRFGHSGSPSSLMTMKASRDNHRFRGRAARVRSWYSLSPEIASDIFAVLMDPCLASRGQHQPERPAEGPMSKRRARKIFKEQVVAGPLQAFVSAFMV